MKQIAIYLEDHEYQRIQKVKGKMTWKELLLEGEGYVRSNLDLKQKNGKLH